VEEEGLVDVLYCRSEAGDFLIGIVDLLFVPDFVSCMSGRESFLIFI
jgi:hypothetical protein